MERKEELNADVIRNKALAYDVLANIEYMTNDYKAKLAELQKRLGEINKQISEKDQELQKILTAEKAAEAKA
jgi:prefoldin subunit 5